MRALLGALLVFAIFLGCESKHHDKGFEEENNVKWVIEVTYLDNTKDTLNILTRDFTTECNIDVNGGIPILSIGNSDYATNVKSFNVISRTILN